MFEIFLCMESIPSYLGRNENFSIEHHLDSLYNEKRDEYEKMYSAQYASKNLFTFKKQLDLFKKLYDYTYRALTIPFFEAIEKKESRVKIKVKLSEEDYYTEKLFYVYKAIQVFCYELTKKNYPWRLNDMSIEIDLQ